MTPPKKLSEKDNSAIYLRERAAGRGLLDRLARQLGIAVTPGRPHTGKTLARALREARQ